MGRDKNQVVIKKPLCYIFRGNGTLTPPGLTMHAAFEGWLLDWALTHSFVVLCENSLKLEKDHLPNDVIYKADYCFEKGGDVLLKYNGGNWMKPIGYQDPNSPPYDMLVKFLGERYERCVLMSHLEDSELRGSLSKTPDFKSFYIEEWKDTALYMKRLIWDNEDGEQVLG